MNTEGEELHYPSSRNPQRKTDRECTVKERREVAVRSRMSMGKAAQKRYVKREKQIPSDTKRTEDKDRE